MRYANLYLYLPMDVAFRGNKYNTRIAADMAAKHERSIEPHTKRVGLIYYKRTDS